MANVDFLRKGGLHDLYNSKYYNNTIVGGTRPRSPCQCLRWAKGPIQGKTPHRLWKGPFSAVDVAEDKGSNLLLVVTLRVIPRNRKSTKQKRTTKKREMSEKKAAIIAFSALNLTKPCISAFTTTPNNWREGLMGQVSALGAQFRRKETTIKRGRRETERGAGNPYQTRRTRKGSSDRVEDQSSLINLVHLSLIVKTPC